MPHFVGVPAIYPKLLEIRKSKDAEFKTNKYWNPDPSVKLRYYQVVGALHMMLLDRMVLGDSTGLGKCVSEDTLIPTNQGFIRIGDLLPDISAEGQFHPHSTTLLSHEGPHQTSHVYDSGIREGLRIETDHGYVLTGLPTHPILASSKQGPSYRLLKDLSQREYVCIRRGGLFSDKPYKISFNLKTSPYTKKYTYPDSVQENLAELFGYYVSGCSDKHRDSFSITQYDQEIHGRIRKLLKDVFGYVQNTGTVKYSTEVDVNSVNIWRFFKELGIRMAETSGGQEVPQSIFRSPREIVRAYLRGYFEGDGGVEKGTGAVSCCSKSQKLMEQTHLLLLSFGIVSRLKRKMVRVKDSRQPYWALYFFGQEVELFQREIGFVSSRKQKELQGICGIPRNTNKDVVPFAGPLIKECLTSIIAHLKTLPEHQGFSTKGSGWKGLVGYKYKRVVESYAYGERMPSIKAVGLFVSTLEKLGFTKNVPHYELLKEIARGDLFFDPIRSITPQQARFVDFTVPVTHNFVGNGFVNHNTSQSLAAYSFVLERDPSTKLLIVCIKSALYQWAEEVGKFLVGVTSRPILNEYKGLEGISARKLQYQEFKENVLVVSYSTILDEYESIKEALGSNYMMVIDEVHSCKNWKTKTYFACNFLASGAKRVYGLSATIIKNGLEEVWGIYSIIVPGLFGKITAFRKKYCQQQLMKLVIGGKMRRIPKTVGYKNLTQFKETLDPYFLCRKKEEVATELPKLVSRKIVLEMYQEQKALYKQALAGILYEDKVRQEFYEIADKVRTSAAPDEKTMRLYNERKEKYEQFLTPDGKKRGKLAALTYCQMISNGPALLKQPGDSSKDDEFIRLVKEELQGEKVLVYSRFASGLPFLEILCERNRLKFAKITGAEGDIERREARISFQESKDCNILFITSAGSASLNLQAASTIIFIDTPWSYGDLVQTIGRAQRIGSIQEHVLLIHLVNKGTIDVRVMDRVGAKKALSDEVLGDTAKGALDFAANENDVLDGLYADLMQDASEIR